jgi:hypothetical protein
VHNGLAQYIHECGKTTINLSKPGGSNLDSFDRISSFLLSNNNLILKKEKVTAILCFQTEWDREYNPNKIIDGYKNIEYPYIKNFYISRFYYRLSDISTRFNVPIYVIGACSDALWLDNFEIEYPGVSIICQSLVNLILNNDHRTSTPVYSFMTARSELLVKNVKENASSSSVELLLNDIDLGNQRFKLVDQHKEFFIETHLRNEHLNVCCYLDKTVEDILSSVKKLDDYDVNKLQSSKMKIQFILKLKNKTGCGDSAIDITCKKELSSKKKVEYLDEYKNLSLRYQGKKQLNFDTIESTQKILIKLFRETMGHSFIKSKRYGNPKRMMYWIDQSSVDHHRLIQSYRKKKEKSKTKKMFKPINKLHDDVLIKKAQ